MLLSLLTISFRSEAVTTFQATVCASGCDYTLFSTAENALDNGPNIASATAVKCGTTTVISGTIADGIGVTWDAGASTGTLNHQSTTQYNISITTGILDAGDTVTDATNSFTATTVDTCAIYMACGANETITDSVLISGFTTSSTNTVTIGVLPAFRHNGTESTGCRINATAGRTIESADSNIFCEWLIVSESVSSASNLSCVASGSGDSNQVFRNLIVDTCNNASAGQYIGMELNGGGGMEAIDNIVYRAESYGIYLNTGAGVTANAYNNSVYLSGNRGIHFLSSGGTKRARNNLAIGNTTLDYTFPTDMTIKESNGSGDTSGDTGLTSLVAATEWTVLTAGSENLHLNSGATSISKGFTQGSTNGVNYDIDNRDRVANNDRWDLGADQTAQASINEITINGIFMASGSDNFFMQ